MNLSQYEYFKTSNGTLYCGDCLEILPSITYKVDLVLTDPPYGIANEVVIARGGKQMKFRGKDISHNFGSWDKFKTLDDYFLSTFEWLDLVVSLLRDGAMAVSFFDKDKINFISHYLQGKDFKCKGYFAFVKSNPVPQARKVKWSNGWEEAGLWQKNGGELTYNYKLGQHPDYMVHSVCSGNERTEHPTQKPLDIISLFVTYWSKINDMVLDPFVGSGTTAVACEKLNRRWIGIEMSEKYCEIAKSRIKAEADQCKMF